MLGFLGPNGAGKTTAMRSVFRLVRPDSGTVTWEGRPIEADDLLRFGYMPEQRGLYPKMRAGDQLAYLGRLHGMSKHAARESAGAWLERFGLGDRIADPVESLSHGNQQRVQLAAALVHDPELLVLDEPTTGLDPAVRHALWSRIRELRASGRSVLLTTHYMDEAERLCDRVLILSEGRAICEGAPRTLIDERLAPEALELDCSPEEEAQLLAGYTGQRMRSGQRLVLYVDSAAPWIERIRHGDGGDRRPLIVRPTNLEDVFLAVTGTSLEGGA
jgi:ABC-2 type transport system ATP-binding protein